MPEKRELIIKYYDMVFKLALSRTGNRHNAEDAAQEAFFRFTKEKKPFESEEHIKAWLIRVTVNCCKDITGSLWNKRVIPLDDNISFESEEYRGIYEAVCELPPKYRTVIHLFYYEDLPIAKISEYLKLKESTVKVRLMRGRKLLGKKLKGEYDFV